MGKGKWIIAGGLMLGGIAAAYGGASWYVGKQVKASLDAGYTELQKYGPYVAVASRRYEGGIFSARETVNIALFAPLPGRPPHKLLEFAVESRIHHLPLAGLSGLRAAAIDSTVSFVPGSIPDEEVWTGGQDLARVHTEVALRGAMSATLSIPAFNAPRLSSEPASFRVEFPAGMARYTVTGSAPRFTLMGDKGERMQISGIRVNGDHRRMLPEVPDMYAGTDRVTIAAVEAAGPGGAAPGYLRQLSGEVNAVPRDKGEFMDITASYSLGSASIGGKTFGPAQLEMSLLHLHTRSFAAMSRVVPPAAASGKQAQEKAAKALLLREPELAWKLVFTVPEGDAAVTAHARLNDVQPEDLAGTPDAMEALKRKVELAVDARLPIGIVIDGAGRSLPFYAPFAQALHRPLDAKGLAQLIAQGYLSQDGNHLQTRFEYREGRYWLNGKEYVAPPAHGKGAVPPGYTH